MAWIRTAVVLGAVLWMTAWPDGGRWWAEGSAAGGSEGLHARADRIEVEGARWSPKRAQERPPETQPRAVSPIHTAVPSHAAARDTLRASVEAGSPLIVALPVQTSGGPVSGYRVAEAPALAGVVGRSMTWITRDADAGTHRLLLEAYRPDAPSDTVTVLVDVQG
jgi:hypothetical protein